MVSVRAECKAEVKKSKPIYRLEGVAIGIGAAIFLLLLYIIWLNVPFVRSTTQRILGYAGVSGTGSTLGVSGSAAGTAFVLTIPNLLKGLHEHAFTMVFTMLLVAMFAYYHVVFYANVMAKDGLSAIQEYIRNAEEIDPEVTEIVNDAQKICTDQQAPANRFIAFIKDKRMIVYFSVIGALLLLTVANLVFQREVIDKMRWVLLPGELAALSLLVLPGLVDAFMSTSIYSKVKYFSNIQLASLIKNIRTCNEMQTLLDLYKSSLTEIQQAKCDQSCLNCLDNTQRAEYIIDLKQYLVTYNSMITEAKDKMSSMAGDRQLFLLSMATAFLAAAVLLCLYWARTVGYNDLSTLVSIITILVLYGVFLGLFLPFIYDKGIAQTMSVNNVVSVLCSGMLN